MENLFFLTHSLAVAAGFITVIVSVHLVRSHRTAFFRAFLIQILAFNLLIILGLILAYIGMRISGGSAIDGLNTLPFWVFALVSITKFVWLYFFVAMNRLLLGELLSRAFRYAFVGISASILLLNLILAYTVAEGSPSTGAIRSYSIVDWAITAGCVLASGYLLIRSRAAEARLRGALRLFGMIYLSAILLLVVILSAGSVVVPGRKDILVLTNSVYLILINLLPLIWVARYQHLTDVSIAHRDGKVNLPQQFLADFGITRRERDVMELACMGKTNQEIADRLFISLQTVKDHMYNIYRKTEVRNRVELANLAHYESASIGGNRGDDSRDGGGQPSP
jgi:DNA-binding CsgD family transcriptional regulator